MSLSVSDSVTRTLSLALDGVSLRQRVTADNIANVDTPGYRAQAVGFEGSLREAIANGELDTHSTDIAVTTYATDTPVGADGNNVDLRKETLAAVQSQYQYQILSRAVSDKYALVRDAIGV